LEKVWKKGMILRSEKGTSISSMYAPTRYFMMTRLREAAVQSIDR